ncbi:glutamate-rich protein 3 isoform X2 [Magallana gigas]|uniref:glutamate-rich protein 3 isoform X2 n=1 Tax=Magallana gigas TaxID=29159 RepID=UPI00333FA6E2
MSHVYEGPLATYNSLTDRNLSGYFSNTRMRRHLRKAGLVNKRGELLSENQYRLNMARKEHKKHVKDMLAQAIVHKSLDMERTRQVEIRRKLEEIAKIELVRRVRSSRGRKGDEEILPYLSPRSSRSASRPETANQQRYRPQSAPSGNHYENVVYVDEHGRELSPNGREDFRTTKAKPQEIDTKHLYALDSAALRKYALQLSRIEQESMSPYLHSPLPTPPRSHRGNRVGSRPRIRSRPRTAEPHRSLSPREKKSAQSSERGSERSYSVSSERDHSLKGTPSRGPRNGYQRRPLNRPRVVEGTLMLHRQEPAMLHQGEVQTLCEITMKYHGPNLTLPRDQYDPTQNISIDQQHCGGNTLTVFKENLKPGDTFSFISRRHRGFPFSLSIFMDGRVDCRVSTCCEYKHAKGVKLGGKMGHFSLLKVEGATPCYKCKLTSKASPRSLKRPPKTQKQPEQLKEEVIVVDRRHVQELSSEVSKSKNKESPKVKEEVKDDVISPEEADEKYDDDFDDDEDEEEEKKDEEKGGQDDSSNNEIHGETIEGLENPCSFEKKSGDKKENEEGEINGKEQNLKTTNKQVRFNAEVQKMGTPESSLSRPEIVNDEDDKAEIEDVKPEDVEDGNPNALVNNEDEGAMDTCDEVSEIETDLESPRKIKENDNMKVEKESESQGDSKKKRNEKDDAENKVIEHDNKPQDKQSDDNYSDDFEGSSESTVISLKDQDEKQKTQDHKNSVPNASRCGEYYDEAYACNGDKLSQHDENACVSVNENAQPNPETISMKSFDEEKKFYVEEDSENEELRQGPLKTTYEDMNIIGPLATLLMKVRRKKREMQSRISVDSESDQDGQKETTSEGFGSSSSLEKESGRLGSQTSLSSLPFENQPNGKKKLQPIVLEKKKRKKKVSSASYLTDSGRISSETNGRARRLSDASIRSFDSHRSVEQALEASQEVVKAVLESQKQMAISIQQVTESSKLVVNSSKEVLESSKQVNESSKQVNESSKQVNESSKQVVEASQQAIDTAMKAINTFKQTEKEFACIVNDNEPTEKVEEAVNVNSTSNQNDDHLIGKEGVVISETEHEANMNTNEEEKVALTFDLRKETDTVEETKYDHSQELEKQPSKRNTKIKQFYLEDFDNLSVEDKFHSISDKDFDMVVSLLDKISDPDTPHKPFKSDVSELHKTNLFDFQDVDILPNRDEINVCDEIHEIFDIPKNSQDQLDGEVQTSVEEMHIPVEYQYTDYSTYFDEQDKRKQGQEHETVKELSLTDAAQCSKENENAYNSSSPFMRQKSENANLFHEESMLTKQRRSQSMPIVVKKKEIEVVKPKTFVYIAKDETLYTETVDVKVREMITDDFSSSTKCSTPRNTLVKEKGETIKFSDDSESSILVHKSSEEDVPLSCASDDQQQDRISLDTSAEADLIVDDLLKTLNSISDPKKEMDCENAQKDEESLLDISIEAGIIVEHVLQKVKLSMGQPCVKESESIDKTSTSNDKKEDTVSIDTTKEAELIVEDVLQRVKSEEMKLFDKHTDGKIRNQEKPITPRTDPDGQVTHCLAEESTVKEHVIYTHGPPETNVKSSPEEEKVYSAESLPKQKEEFSKPRPLKRQEALHNLFEAVDRETTLEIQQNSLTEQNEDDFSLCTSEEASLIVKRVIEGMSNEESRKNDEQINDRSNAVTDSANFDSENTASLHTDHLVLRETKIEEISTSFTRGINEEKSLHLTADENNFIPQVELQDIHDDSEISNLEPIPIEKEEVRSIACPVVDVVDVSEPLNKSQEMPRLVKAKSGALIVQYAETDQMTIKKTIYKTNEGKEKVPDRSKENTGHNSPRIAVKEASVISSGIDKSNSTSKNKVDEIEIKDTDQGHKEVTALNTLNEQDKMNGNKEEHVKKAQTDTDKIQTDQEAKNQKLCERKDSNASVSSSSESSETDIKFYMNGEEVKYPKDFQNDKSTDGTPNFLEIDGQMIDLDNLENLDKETYKKVMAVAYNIDVMSTISEEHSTSQSTAHLSNK